jgi:predicted O-methyltransferase YrrM
VYLLSFIVAFDSPRWYRRGPFLVALAAALGTMTLLLNDLFDPSLTLEIVLYTVSLFVIVMVLHGELARLKPPPERLTFFYLMVAAGGATGGVLAGVVAPLVFDGPWEFHLGLAGSALLVLLVVGREWLGDGTGRPRRTGAAMATAALVGVAVLSFGLTRHAVGFAGSVDAMERSFYGVLRVSEAGFDRESLVLTAMHHGRILHGSQFVVLEKRDWATSYYGADGGAGISLLHHPGRRSAIPAPGDASRGLRIGVVGLGAGTVAAYAGAGDHMVFYEIDPVVVELAEEHFTFVADAEGRGAEVEILIGDARLVMERQVAAGERPEYDVLVVDAFSGDAVPVHLLTREAFDVYWALLAPDGVLAVHVSNQHIDLSPVVRGTAAEHGKQALRVRSADRTLRDLSVSEWILVTDNAAFLGSEPVRASVDVWPADAPEPLVWTDDFSDVLGLLR